VCRTDLFRRVGAAPRVADYASSVENGLPSRTPSGLFPSGPHRPSYREPHPVRLAGVLTGAGVTAVWLLLFALLATSARSLAWLLLLASGLAWVAALVLVRVGDRGVAVGTALSAGAGITIVGILVVARWATTGWFLW
jgi:hypothetical protein